MENKSNRGVPFYLLFKDFTPNRYGSDLSNEVLYALVGQDTAKILVVKVGG